MCHSPGPSLGLSLSVTWEMVGLAASGDEMHPHAGVSNNNANTCTVIRAVYWVIGTILSSLHNSLCFYIQNLHARLTTTQEGKCSFSLVNLFIYLLIFGLCWVFVAAQGLSLLAVSRATLPCGARFSLWCLLL